ncbi:MAG: hypothetical protein HYZ29_29190 [Myxococcales bacterium]|nr:hypothetical protein [Myxococcales bacterium]
MRAGSFLLLVAMGLGVAFACGGDDGGGTASNSGGAGGTNTGGSGNASDGSAATGGGLVIDGGDASLSLSIEPANPVLTATGGPVTQQFTAKLSNGGSTSAATWEIDDVVVGTVAKSGVFTSPGWVAGTAVVSAKLGNLTASTNVTVKVQVSDNPGNVTAGDQALLKAGGSADSAFKWLYPYDKTVFPRGVPAPTLQLGGAAASATYLKISVKDFSYEGFFAGSAPTRVDVPAAVWKGLALSEGADAGVNVEVSKLSGGQATGPVKQTWKIAKGSLSGIIYYNSYFSKLAGTGGVMRIKPGQNAEVFIGNCTVCHSVSSKGTVIAAGVSWATDNPVDSATWDIAADGSAKQRVKDPDGRKMSFGALTPDGKWLLSNGSMAGTSPVRGLSGDFPSKLWDTMNAAEVATPSFTSQIKYALTPVFSHDGKLLAFNRWEQGAGKTLSVMDFDSSQSPPAFTNLQNVVTAQGAVAGWPSFLPDGKGLLYHDGEKFDTAGFGATPAFAELRLVDLSSKTVNSIEALNGRAGGSLYLPYGETEEGKLNYEPTVLPVAVGGYYWVVFTSRRAYGNTVSPGGTVAGGDNKWGTYVGGAENPSPRKKLWVAAIDVSWQGAPDPSHPAFYLSGQELDAGNMRAFAALEPCKADGADCESAAECCNGFCRPTDETNDAGGPVTKCVPPPPGCSKEEEACKTAADCCDVAAGFLCVNGRCTKPTPK